MLATEFARPATPKLSTREYLDAERLAEFRHEYHRGEVFEMVGGSFQRNLIVTNLIGLLCTHCDDRDCEAFMCDMRIRVEAADLYAYPKVIVVRGEARFEDAVTDTLLNPTVLIEFRSDYAENWHHGRKLGYYRQCPSVREIVLLDEDRPWAERQTRTADGWRLNDLYGLDAVLELPSIDARLPLGEVYDRVKFAPT